jgi:hypothetical protein
MMEMMGDDQNLKAALPVMPARVLGIALSIAGLLLLRYSPEK